MDVLEIWFNNNVMFTYLVQRTCFTTDCTTNSAEVGLTVGNDHFDWGCGIHQLNQLAKKVNVRKGAKLLPDPIQLAVNSPG